MFKKTCCYLCLSVNKRTINIYKTNLQYVYENLANKNIRGNECWMCYICHTRLRQCHQLQQLAVQTRSLVDSLCQNKINIEFGVFGSLIELSIFKTKNISTTYSSLLDIKQESDVKPEPCNDDVLEDENVENTCGYEEYEQFLKESEYNNLLFGDASCKQDSLNMDQNDDWQGSKVLELKMVRLSQSVIDKYVRQSPTTHTATGEYHEVRAEHTAPLCADEQEEIKLEVEEDLRDKGNENKENQPEFENIQQPEKINEETSDSISAFSDTCSNYTPPRDTSLEESFLEELGTLQESPLKEVNQICDKSAISSNNLVLLGCVPVSNTQIDPPTNLDHSECSHLSGSPCSFVAVNRKCIQSVSLPLNGAEKIEPNHEVGLDICNESQVEDSSNDSTKIIQRKNPKSTSKVREKDYCFYCEMFVQNFARHLLRHHEYEYDVQKIISKPKKSLERKKLLAALRKKGNYLVNSKEVTKPMRKQKFTDYLPCTDCLGFYSKKLLWKHKKKCTGKNASKNVQSEAQNLLIRHLKIDKNIKETVFPRMRADKISLVAKTDLLICAFGSQYLKVHRERHFVNVASRKMRELAKLLMEIKKIDPSIKDLCDVLRPNNYKIIVEATKILGKYDSEKERYETPTLAMNMSTTLKQCCNIAIMFALKKQGPYMDVETGKIEADLKTTIQLIESNWKHDVSSQAAIDLNKKKCNKVTIVPLASDLKILKEYLNKKSLEASVNIKEGLKNISMYTQLLETVYCRVLLLNRRRPGELQRITLHDYLESEKNASDKNEEFDRALTASERILVRKFKRVVIRGKRGRGVPVLFTQELQDDIKLLLSIRDICFATKPNIFLFGNPGYENTIYGYKVFERYARLSGAKNPKAMTSTRLRKHLATLSQIFCMSENDLEQLATFMGHTNKVHKKSYRLPDDVYQTAKISKLLILMENGKADAFKSKSLEDIDLDMDEELDEEILDNDQILDYDCEPNVVVNSDCVQNMPNQNNLSQAGPSGFQNMSQLCVGEQVKNKIKTVKKRTLVPWTKQQKYVVTNFFEFHIKNRQPPKRHECEKLKEHHGALLENKDWLKIKVFVQNTYSKK